MSSRTTSASSISGFAQRTWKACTRTMRWRWRQKALRAATLPSEARLQLAKHHEHVDEAEPRVPECVWYTPDNSEAMLLPQLDRYFIRTDDVVESHRTEARVARFVQRMLA